jgi:hypothetical protein
MNEQPHEHVLDVELQPRRSKSAPHHLIVRLYFDNNSKLINTNETRQALTLYRFPKEKRHFCRLCDHEIYYKDFMDYYCENVGYHQMKSSDLFYQRHEQSLLVDRTVRIGHDGRVLTREFQRRAHEMIYVYNAKCVKCDRYIKIRHERPITFMSSCSIL